MTANPHVYGIKAHPDKVRLSEYQFTAPEGQWIGKLDDRAWGDAMNLFCYFTEISSGEKYRLSVFSSHNYKPFKGIVCMRLEPLGGQYQITTEFSKNGFPKFMSALKFG